MAYPVGLRNPRQILGLIRQIRAHRISTVVNLTSFRSVTATWRDEAFFRLAGVRRTIGFSTKVADRAPRLDSQTGQVEWEARRLARRVASLREVDLKEDHWWNLRLSEVELGAANVLLQPVQPAVRRLALSVGTKVQAKDWGAANWIELTKRLNAKLPGFGLVLVGANDEREISDACLREWSGPGVNLCGRGSPRVSAAALRQCQLFVGVDSGPMHLAACVGVPCVAIFAARNLPVQWFPRGDRNRVIYHPTDCAGCQLEVCVAQKKKCLTSITVSEVEQHILAALNQPV
jgi:ADP-heptose:LPS heptosyltransferase